MSDAASWPLYGATIMLPEGVRPEDLNQPSHVRQCWVYCRAKSRAAFARSLIRAGVEDRSPAAVAAWAREWANDDVGGVVADEITDNQVWLGGLNDFDRDHTLIPYDLKRRESA